MAYGTKYMASFYDELGRHVEVSLDYEDYTGSSSYITLGAEPLIIKWNGRGDKRYDVFKVSSTTLSIHSESNFQYSEFFDISDREIKMTVTVDSSTLWAGFVNPGLYSEPYSY